MATTVISILVGAFALALGGLAWLTVLRRRASLASGAPAPPPPAGTVYASSVRDRPLGLGPSSVAWVPVSKFGTEIKALDAAGREWRLRDAEGDLILVWKR